MEERESISSVDLLTERITAPISCKILVIAVTSVIFGTFSIRQTPSDRITAGMIAIAAFFAPLIDTSPVSRVPPVITNLSNAVRSNRQFNLSGNSVPDGALKKSQFTGGIARFFRKRCKMKSFCTYFASY